MATRVWRSAAAPVAQIETITVTGPVVAGEVWNATINGRTVSFTATAGTTANVVSGLTTALNASEFAEFAEVTWAASDPTIVGTADTEGVPFTLTVSTDSAGGSIGRATTVAATGPNHWDNANNWSGATVPITGDTVFADLSQGSILYGLAQSAVTLAVLRVTSPAFTNNTLGLPLRNGAGYSEYRDTSLAIGATSCVVDCGAQRMKIDFGSVQTAAEVRRTGAPAETGVPAALLKGTHASNTVEVQAGSVGIAFHGGESMTVATLLANAEAKVECGAGATLGTIKSLGQVAAQTNVTAATVTGGDFKLTGSATLGTLEVDGANARVKYESSGTCTTANIGPGIVDASGDLSSRTFTTTTLRAGGKIIDPRKTITHTNGIAVGTTVSQIAAE